MAIIAGLDKNDEGVTGNSMTVHCLSFIFIRTGQVAINAMNVDLGMNRVGGTLCLILMATGTQSIGCRRRVCLLGMNLMAIDAGHPHRAMTT